MDNTMRVTYRDGTALNVRVPPEGLKRVLALHGWESAQEFASALEGELTGIERISRQAEFIRQLRRADLDSVLARWR